MGYSRQEYCSGLPCPPSSSGFSRPRDQTHVTCLQYWQPGSLPLAPPGSPKWDICQHSEVTGYKINVIKSVVFLYTNSKLSEKVIKKLTPVIVTLKKYEIPRNKSNIKYLYLFFLFLHDKIFTCVSHLSPVFTHSGYLF